MTFSVVDDLAVALAEAYGTDQLTISSDLCPPDQGGEITINCFRFARDLRANPMEVAAKASEFLTAHTDVTEVTVVKAFVNVTLTGAALFRDTVSDFGHFTDVRVSEANRRRIVIEYSAPNTNKPQHLGHVRNNTLGASISALLTRAGHDVVPVNLVNDRGIAICKSMLAYERFGDGCTPESTGKKGDHLIGDFYIRFDKELREQRAALRAERPDLAETKDDALFLETEIGRTAHDMLIAWEAGDPDVRALWEKLNTWVLAGFDETYNRMGVKFDRTYFESDTWILGKEIVDEGLAKGIFYKRDDGATEIDLAAEKMDKKVVLRSDGTSVYVTQDLGTTLLKHNDFGPQSMIWVVGDEQIYHFRVLFAILKRLGYEWADSLYHLAYGMVHLPSGKMKSREGTVVDADDLLDKMHEIAMEKTRERYGDDPPADLRDRVENIGQGALKFMLLKVNARSSLKFDPEAAVEMVGDTGPYVMYAHARISSMFREAGNEAADNPDWSLLGEKAERQLALRCALFGFFIRKAAADLDPAPLAGYLIDVAKDFNRFYHDCKVLKAETPELVRARLALCARVRFILKDGLAALGIHAPEEM